MIFWTYARCGWYGILPQEFTTGPASISARFVHESNEYAQSVGLLMERDEKEPVAMLVESLSKSLAQEVRRRPHPLLYVNLSLVLTMVFAAGIFYARFNELEAQVQRMRATETLAVRVEGLQGQMDSFKADVVRLTERLDRVLDKPATANRGQRDDR